MIIYTIELEGDYITFAGIVGTAMEGIKSSYRALAVKEVISDVTDNALTLVMSGNGTVSYDYTEVENPSTPNIAFTDISAFRTYILTNITSPVAETFLLEDGSGTTANANSVDLGGTLSDTTEILTPEEILGIRLRNNSVAIGDISLGGLGENGYAFVAVDPTSVLIRAVNNSIEVKTDYISIVTNGGDGIRLTGSKTGATQAASGAIGTEIWITSGHATLPDGVMMVGV